jgi:DNA-binding response OmpR family regulator
MLKENILVVDDDSEIRELIVKYLKKENMIIKEACDGYEAIEFIKNGKFDLMILDIMMDGLDGFEVLRQIRTDNVYLPVIILSAREEDFDKVLGLGLGADDYVTKPFSPNELIARVKSQIRRQKLIQGNVKEDLRTINSGVFSIDLNSYKITKNNLAIELSAKEFNLLKFFIENPDRVFTKQQIYENVWKDGYFDENTVTVYIRHLREKIEDNSNKPEYITTVWGIGYKFNCGKIN